MLKKELLGHLRSGTSLPRGARQANTAAQRPAARSPAASRSASGRRRSRTVRSRATGKATCSSAPQQLHRHARRAPLALRDAGRRSTAETPPRSSAALTRKMQQLPRELRRSLTWDRGIEMAEHGAVHRRDRREGVLLRPQSPWQRGTTRTPTACCASTSPRAPICRYTPSDTSTHRPTDSTAGRGRRSASEVPRKSWPKRCVDRLSQQCPLFPIPANGACQPAPSRTPAG